MKIVKKFFENKIILIEFDKHKDKRGFFTELYNAKIFREIGIEDKFNQDNYSYSKKKRNYKRFAFSKFTVCSI